jgi:hypothetical protein
MIEYGRAYNTHEDGLYVKIQKDQVEVFSKMYSDEVEAEFYFHEVHIEPDIMKVVMIAITGEVLSVIYHAKRIWDLR